MEYIQLAGGLILLIISGNYLIDSATDIAKKFKLPTLVIGMTVVAFGTSAPELVVSASAALNNHPDIAMGNAIGSNISNIGLIMGLAALIYPIKVLKKTITTDWSVMLFSSVLFLLASLNGVISRWEGVIDRKSVV